MELSADISKILEEQNPDAKVGMMSDLIESGEISNESINMFVTLLADENAGVRDAAFRGLNLLPPDKKLMAAKKAAQYIEHSDIVIRNLAGDLLMKMGAEVSPALEPYLNSRNPDVRKFACDILGHIGTPDKVDMILKLISDDDKNVKLSAVESTGYILSNFDVPNDVARKVIMICSELYDTDDEAKPHVIETLGKAGGILSQNKLINLLENEEDDFLKTIIIDALSIDAKNPEIIDKLISILGNYKENLQGVILKTIYAVAMRSGTEVDLPDEFRYVAHNALLDDDPDIRTAGLLALGSNYGLEDVPGLINEYSSNDPETQSLILFNMVYHSHQDVTFIFIEKLFEKYSGEDSAFRSEELINALSSIWNSDMTVENERVVENIILLSVKFLNGYESELIEPLRQLDSNITDSAIKKIVLEHNDSRFDELKAYLTEKGIL
jgi:HEAT repeat protein